MATQNQSLSQEYGGLVVRFHRLQEVARDAVLVCPRRGLVPERDGRQLRHLCLQGSDFGVHVIMGRGLVVGRIGSLITINVTITITITIFAGSGGSGDGGGLKP